MVRLGLYFMSACLALLMSGCMVQPVPPPPAAPPAEAATPIPVEGRSPLTADVLKNLAYHLEVVGADPVQLTDGIYEDAANQVLVSWVDTYALGELNGQPAAAVILVANTGGSGVFSTLSVVIEQAGAATDVTSLLLGDRLRMNWITIVNNEIVLDLVGQGPDEPMCCGTQRALLRFALEGEQLVETDAVVIGIQPQITSTQVIIFVPEIVPDVSQPGSCFANAIGLGRADAWRCTTDDNVIHDPCFVVDDAPTVVCGADPITGESGFVLELTEALPTPDVDMAADAWLVQLSDGTVCGLLTGTIPGVGDQVAPYGCADEARSNLMAEFLVFDPVWFAQSAVFDLDDQGFFIESSVRIPVATIWR